VTVWRDGLNGYLGPLGVPPIAVENPSVVRLHRHALATDPGLFRVATVTDDEDGGGERVIGFVSAVVRGPVWFLSMLFVDPAEQGGGIGRALLREVLPTPLDGAVLATATDAAQPVSNGLYASHGIVPRMPLLYAVGRPRDGARLPALPAGIVGLRVAAPAPDQRDATLAGELDELDRSVLGFAHPEDHAHVRGEGRTLFVYRDGGGRLVGYGYTSEVGRISPVAVRDEELLPAVMAHLLTTVEPRGASAVWIPGAAGRALTTVLDAGLRIEGFPILIAWSRPFADFARYVPISPGLL
jgi:GNAT superfamily N-acetyltransferase